jgi:hypothetical protein
MFSISIKLQIIIYIYIITIIYNNHINYTYSQAISKQLFTWWSLAGVSIINKSLLQIGHRHSGITSSIGALSSIVLPFNEAHPSSHFPFLCTYI